MLYWLLELPWGKILLTFFIVLLLVFIYAGLFRPISILETRMPGGYYLYKNFEGKAQNVDAKAVIVNNEIKELEKQLGVTITAKKDMRIVYDDPCGIRDEEKCR